MVKYTQYEWKLLAELYQLIRKYKKDHSQIQLIPIDKCPKCDMIIRVDYTNWLKHLYYCPKVKKRYND